MKKSLFILLLLSTKIINAQVSAQVCFSPAVNYAAGSSPYSVCSADFNNDGAQDMAAANYSTNNVSVFINSGTGTFGTATNYGAGGGANAITSGDFNNDGAADLAVANYTANSVSILLGNGSGGFTLFVNKAVGTNPESIVSADFNSDGNLDIATANDGSNNVSVLLGNGAGNFGAATNFGAGTGAYCIISSDFNNDGKKDLAVANYGANSVSILIGSGTGTFTLWVNLAVGTNPASLTSADFNGDGNADLAVANEVSGNISILLGIGNGNFGAASNFALGNNPFSICTGDFDGDLKTDLVTANYSANNVSVLLGNGSGSFSVSGTFAVGNTPYSVCSADFNLDGKADIAAANDASSSNNVSVLLNNLPKTSVSGNMAICIGGTTILTAGGASSYSWSGGITTNTISISSSATTSYTVTGLNSGCSVSSSAIVTVTVNPSPTLTVSALPSTICSGQSSTLTATGATNYTWMPGGSTTASVSETLNATTTYTLTGDNGSCTATQTVTINVNATPTVTANASATVVCSGTPVTLTGGGAGTYTWSGGVSDGVAFTPTATATYSVSGIYGNGNTCTANSAITITVNPLPNVSANATATLVCAGTMITLTGSGTATTYTWTGGVTDGVSFPAVAQTYTVTGTDGNNCSNTASISINAPASTAPDICMVTVDSLSINNVIYWDKTSYPSADTFLIYRDTSNNNYALIGKVPKSALSLFTDTSRHIGAVNGDPNITTYRYKLAYKDSCGNISPKSPYHNTVYSYNSGSLFLWNQYGIEGQSSPVPALSSYLLRRDNYNTGNWITAATAGASSTSINDPQYSTYQATANWRVETQWSISCTPTMRYGYGTQTTIVRSKSNIANNRTTGTSSLTQGEKHASVYPIPAGSNINVETSSVPLTIELMTLTGEVISKVKPVNTVSEIDLRNVSAGVYFIKVQLAVGMQCIKIIKQ